MKSKKGYGLRRLAKYICFLLKPIWTNGRSYIVVSFLSAMLIAPLAPVTYVLLTQKVVDSIGNGESFFNTVLLICILYGANMGVWAIRTGIRELFLNLKREKIASRINIESYKQGIITDYKYYDDPEFFDNYTWAVSEYADKSFGLVETLCSLATAFSTITALVSIISTSGPVIIILSIIQLTVTSIIESKRNKLNLKIKEDSMMFDRKIGYVHRAMYSKNCVQDIKVTRIQKHLMNMLEDNVHRKIETHKKYNPILFANSFSNVLTAFLTEGGIMVYICYGIMISGSIHGAGMFLGMFYAAQNLVSSLQDFFSVWVNINEYTLYAKKIETFFNLPSTIEKNNSTICCSSPSSIKTPFSVELKNVSFSYKDSVFALKNLNFAIRPGEKIAIVGENGAGKSTLAKLLLRLYDVTSGEILYNELSIKEYPIDELRSKIGVSFQESQIYALPLSDNISAYDDYDDQTLENAVRVAGLSQALIKNNATIKSEMTREFDAEGVILSGGETQKLAFSRLIPALDRKELGLIVLDEPSSALDPIAEYELGKLILNKSNTATTIIVSHRLSLVTKMDRIIVMSEGTIEEEGTHEELMKRKGLYYLMFTKQAENYIA